MTRSNQPDPDAAPIKARRKGRLPSTPRPRMTTDGVRRVRVLCVDDHAVLVEGLRAQFEIDGYVEIVASLPSPDGLLEEVSRSKPDVVLLDIEMPGPDVFETADRLRHMYSRLPFIFLSAHIREGYLAAAYNCGASGYFAKGDELDDIVSGVKKVAQAASGTFVMGPKVRERCRPKGPGASRSRSQIDERPKTPFDTLTAREIEVLRLIGNGLSRTEIAAELSRSVKTIDGHQERLMKKLDIGGRAELMRFAIREGLAEA